MALCAAMGVLGATVLLVHLLREEHQRHYRNELDIELRRATEKVEAQMEERILALSRMARRWEVSGAPAREAWEDDASLYLQHFKSFQAIGWADSSHHVRWVLPLRGNEAVQGFDVMSEPRRREAAMRAQEGGTVEVSRTVELVQRGTGFLVFVPIFRQQHFEGTLIGAFRVRDTLETILGPDFRSRFSMLVLEDEQPIYQSLLPGVPVEGEWVREGTLRFRSVEWRVRLKPGPWWKDPVRSVLPWGVLSGGCVLSALVFVSIFLAFKARSRSRQLEELFAFHQAILNGTHYGIISTGQDGIIRVFNKGAEHMLGYRAEEVVGKVTPMVFHDPLELAERARKLSQVLGREVAPGFEVLRPRVFGVGSEAADSEWHFIRKDGSRVLTQLTLFALRNAQGEITQFVGIAHDITARRQAELARARAQEAAEEAVRARLEFLSREGSEGSEEVLERGRLLSHVGGDAGLMQDVVHLFLGELPALWADLEEGVRGGDALRVTRAAHKLTGALLNLTAGPAANAARKLEELGRGGQLVEAAGALERLRRELARLQGVLEVLHAAG